MSTETAIERPGDLGQGQMGVKPVLDPALLCSEKSLVKHEDLVPVRQSATTTAAEALLQRSRRTWFQGQAMTNIKVTPRSGATRVKIKPSPPSSPTGDGQNEVCVISQLFVTFNNNSLYHKGDVSPTNGEQGHTDMDRF